MKRDSETGYFALTSLYINNFVMGSIKDFMKTLEAYEIIIQCLLF